MKTESLSLIDSLTELTERHLRELARLQSLDAHRLNQKPAPGAWSALECAEHLRRYLGFYVPEIRRAIGSSSHPFSAEFRSGWLGNYFAMSMWPKEKPNPMRTFKAMNPEGSALSAQVLDELTAQLKELLELLQAARSVNLQKTRTAITISSWITLRLGDTLRFVIFHHERHLRQAFRAAGLE
jgi:hypothetical protein